MKPDEVDILLDDIGSGLGCTPYLDGGAIQRAEDALSRLRHHLSEHLIRLREGPNLWIGYCDLCNGQHCVQTLAANAGDIERTPHRETPRGLAEDRDYFKAAYARKLDDEKKALESAAALSEENARLRAALRDIETKAMIQRNPLIRDNARAALAGKPDEPQEEKP